MEEPSLSLIVHVFHLLTSRQFVLWKWYGVTVDIRLHHCTLGWSQGYNYDVVLCGYKKLILSLIAHFFTGNLPTFFTSFSVSDTEWVWCHSWLEKIVWSQRQSWGWSLCAGSAASDLDRAYFSPPHFPTIHCLKVDYSHSGYQITPLDYQLVQSQQLWCQPFRVKRAASVLDCALFHGKLTNFFTSVSVCDTYGNRAKFEIRCDTSVEIIRLTYE